LGSTATRRGYCMPWRQPRKPFALMPERYAVRRNSNRVDPVDHPQGPYRLCIERLGCRRSRSGDRIACSGPIASQVEEASPASCTAVARR
jgi:hypothetical protein